MWDDDTNDPELAEAIEAMREADEVYGAAETARKKAREYVVSLMALREQRESDVVIGNKTFKVKIIAAERTKVDEAGLRKELGVRAYNKLAKPAPIDPGKLEKAIQEGQVDLERIKPYLSIVTSAAYPKVDLVEETS